MPKRAPPPTRPAARAPGRVRIIAGRFRGRVVRFPGAEDLRPTPDRVRETLFNWLGQDLTELRTLDLYAGTGVLSLESLSRGAAHAVAVDRDPARIAALAQTASTFGAEGLDARVGDVRGFLARETRSFDVIFADPPFATDEWTWLLPACEARLAAGGFIYAEAGRSIEPPPPLEAWRRSQAGQVHYHLLRRIVHLPAAAQAAARNP